MRRLSLIVAITLAAPALAGCIVPEDMPALREELGYASVERPDIVVHARATTLTPIVEQPVDLTAEIEGVPTSEIDVTWTVNGTERDGAQVTVSFPTPGERPVQVEAVGPNGTTASDGLTLDVGPNAPPEPSLSIENRDGLRSDAPVVIRADGSSDPDGDELTYEWRLDGEERDAGARLVANLTAGSHDVELRVTDGHVIRETSETFAVDRPISHEAQVSLTGEDARVTVPVREAAEELTVRLNHTSLAGVDDVNLTLVGPDGDLVARASTAPEPGASQGTERLSVDGSELGTGPHTLVAALERGTEATVTIEGVLTYSPLPSPPR